MTYSSAAWISLGVFAAAGLVNHNRFVLVKLDIGGSAPFVLASLHNLVTYAFIRMKNSNLQIAGLDSLKETQIRFLTLCIATCATVSITSSNLLLKENNVAFHQVCRLFTIPVSAVYDGFIEKKRRTCTEIILMLLVCSFGVGATSLGSGPRELLSVLIATAFIISSVATAVLVRTACRISQISAEDILRLTLPYSILATFLGLLTQTPKFTRVGSHKSLPFLPSAIMHLSFNLILAISVQYLSTWTMQEVSTPLYAVLGQVKTALTLLIAYSGNVETELHAVPPLLALIFAASALVAVETKLSDGDSPVIKCVNFALLSYLLYSLLGHGHHS